MSNKLIVRCFADRKSALLKGIVLDERVDIEVGMEDVGANWALLVQSLHMDKQPPILNQIGTLGSTTFVAGNTAADLAAALEKAVEAIALQKDEAAHEMDVAEAALAAFDPETVALPMGPVTVYQTKDGSIAMSPPANYTDTVLTKVEGPYGDSVKVPSVPYIFSGPLRSRYDTLEPQRNALLGAIKARVAREREAILQREMPKLLELAAAKQLEREQAAQAEKAEKAARFAARLETGIYEHAVGAYNERRYSSPWIAAVSLGPDGKLTYDFKAGDCTAKWGKPGIVTIACKPGEVIAWGQKDLRKPAASEHHILLMRPDGGMDEIDRTQALKHLRS